MNGPTNRVYVSAPSFTRFKVVFGGAAKVMGGILLGEDFPPMNLKFARDHQQLAMELRIGVIADIHSNLAAFRAVLEDMPRVDELICVGDFVGYAAEPNEVVRLAKMKGMRAVTGNHDYAALTRDVRGLGTIAAKAALWTSDELNEENSKFLSELPVYLKLSRVNHKLYVVHGSPRDSLDEYVFPESSNRLLAELARDLDADIVLMGHTHRPMKRLIYGKLLVNPGGVGQPRDRDPRASYAVLNINEEVEVEHRRVGYDVEITAHKIEAAGLPSELAMRLFFGW